MDKSGGRAIINRLWSEAECTEKVCTKSRRPGGMPQWLMLCPVPHNRPSATQLLYILPIRSLHGRLLSARPDGLGWENISIDWTNWTIFLKHIVSAAKIGSEKGLEGAVSNSG